MSRIGKAPIPLPQGVTVTINGDEIKVKGPKAELTRTIRPEIKLEQEDGKLTVKRSSEDRIVRALHGLTRTLVANMVIGVTAGFSKNLEIVGVGYRAAVKGNILELSVGHSTIMDGTNSVPQIQLPIPDGITVTVTKERSLLVSGADKQVLGDFCALIRSQRPPEVYKGKGIKYANEVIRRKAGKAAGKKK